MSSSIDSSSIAPVPRCIRTRDLVALQESRWPSTSAGLLRGHSLTHGRWSPSILDARQSTNAGRSGPAPNRSVANQAANAGATSAQSTGPTQPAIPEVDALLQSGLLRKAKPAGDGCPLSQEDCLRLMGLLDEKIVASGNYLKQGTPRQKAALQALATALGTTWETRDNIRKKFGSVPRGTTSGKHLMGIVVSDSGKLALGNESAALAKESHGDVMTAYKQLGVALGRHGKHVDKTVSDLQPPVKEDGDDGYDFASLRADNGGTLGNCSICQDEIKFNNANEAVVCYPCDPKIPHLFHHSCLLTLQAGWEARKCPCCMNKIDRLLMLDDSGKVLKKETLPPPSKGSAPLLLGSVLPSLQFNNAGVYWLSMGGPQRPAAVAANTAITHSIGRSAPLASSTISAPPSNRFELPFLLDDAQLAKGNLYLHKMDKRRRLCIYKTSINAAQVRMVQVGQRRSRGGERMVRLLSLRKARRAWVEYQRFWESSGDNDS